MYKKHLIGEVNFTQQLYKPVLGRTTLFSNNFQSGNSTLPLTFEITRIVKADGSPAPELTDVFPVTVWKVLILEQRENS